MQLLYAKMALLVRKRLLHIIEHVLTPFPRYIADYVYALPTIAFFLSGLGMFIIGHLISSQMLGYRKFRGPLVWQKSIAFIRYLSYRGFHIKTLRWNSAPVGVLLLGAVGAVYFCCESRIHDVLSRGVLTDDIVSRHGPGTTALLLVERRLRRLTTTRDQIGLDGIGLYAFRLVCPS
jgi:hypothetical protein